MNDNPNQQSRGSGAREFDLVVWGATGFTGQLVAQHLLRHYGANRDLTWAMGGRNLEKLENVRRAWGAEAAGIPLVLADSMDATSMDQLVQRTAVVCTTVGPYAKYGSALVSACSRHGTHYCDLTGEVPWMRQMIDRHETEARDSGARIVHCCGFDSIPSDLGCYLLQEAALQQSGQPCQSVKLGVGRIRGGISGGTVASLLNILEQSQHDPKVWVTVTDPFALVPHSHQDQTQVQDQMGVRWDADFESWTGPFIMAMINTRVVHRSNMLMDHRYGPDFAYTEAQLTGRGLSGWTMAAGLASGMNCGLTVLRRRALRNLAQRWIFPQPGDGPSPKIRDAGSFQIFLAGNPRGEGRSTYRATILGDSDPGYGCTSKMLAESAMCLVQDAPAINVPGGFWTPASCLGTLIVKRLERSAGMRFEVKGLTRSE